MTLREVVRKLRAFEAERALPRYETLLTAVSDNAYVVSFVRMGGESRPWAVAYGPSGSQPKFGWVIDARRREDVQGMMSEFADDLLDHFRAEGFSFEPILIEDLPVQAPPQLWVPGSSHVDMLHYLSYAYWRRRAEDDQSESVHALSRFCGWIFRESSSTGQQLLVDASAALREAYVFPTDDFALSHLGVQTCWLAKRGSYRERLLAGRAVAENSLGITMNPDVEKELQAQLEDYYKFQKTQQDTSKFEDRIRSILESQTLSRWTETVEAIEILRKDSRKVNEGLATLVLDSLSRYYYDFQRLERQFADPDRGPAFTPHPETDHHGSAAASSYYLKSAADSKYLPTLVHYDSELLKESLADGHSVKATVTEVKVDSNGRYKEVFWTIRCEASDDFRMRSGEYLSPLGNPGHKVKTISVEFVSETDVEIMLEWQARKTLEVTGAIDAKPSDEKWVGEEATFVPFDNSDFEIKASRAVWDSRNGSGSWLTHSKAQRFPDEKVIDDVVQIEGPGE